MAGLRSNEPYSSHTLDARIHKIYGTREAYEAAVSVLEPGQRENYERAGIVLQPKQLLFAKLAREADNPGAPDELGLGGGRGGGKSVNVFAQAMVDDSIRFPGLKTLYLRKTAKAGQEQMSDLVTSVLARVPCDARATRIIFPNGSRAVIGGYKDDEQAASYQGIEYDLLIIEELTQLSENTYKTLRLSARSSKGWRPRVYTTFNPRGPGHLWVKARFVLPARKKAETTTRFIHTTIEDNVFVDPDYVDKLNDLTGDALLAYRWGEWDIASGAYFETWRYDAHVIPPLEDIPAHWRVWCAMDAGYSHWNIVLFLAEDSDGRVYCFHELAHRKEHPQGIAPDILATCKRYGLNIYNLPFVVGTDAFRLTAGQNDTLADQYRLYGITMSPADMSPGSRINGWQVVSRMLGNPADGRAPNLLITSNCTRLIESIPVAERDVNNPEDVRKFDTDEQGNGGDDALDALRYGVTSRDAVGVYAGSMTYGQYNTFQGAE